MGSDPDKDGLLLYGIPNGNAVRAKPDCVELEVVSDERERWRFWLKDGDHESLLYECVAWPNGRGHL